MFEISDSTLSEMTDEDIKELQQRILGELEKRTDQRIEELQGEINKIASSVGKTPEELLRRLPKSAKKKAKSPAAARYRNPSNPEQTWAGRGKRPKWLTEALENGHTLDEFLIPDA